MTDQNVSQGAADAANTVTVARADVDSLPAGSAGPANGNVITGQGTDSGLNGADTVAHTPAHIVAVQGAGAAQSVANNGAEVTGHFGVLTMNADARFITSRTLAPPPAFKMCLVIPLRMLPAASRRAPSRSILEWLELRLRRPHRSKRIFRREW